MIEEEMAKILEVQDQKNSEYHFKKNKVFDVYGKTRPGIPRIKSLLESNPQHETNNRYIEIESQTDQRIKISSMARRMYMEAPSTTQVRHEGHHQDLIKSLDKNNVHEDLLEKKKLMETSATEDKLQKDLIIYPDYINFGNLKVGTFYETKLLVKNEDS